MNDYDSGYIDGKAVMYERIAELEADAEIREEANRKLLSFGIKTGMERAAEIAGKCSMDRHRHTAGDAAEAIRKEIEE